MVGENVCEGVAVGVDVFVAVFDAVTVAVRVGVVVLVTVLVDVMVGVNVGVKVCVGNNVGELVGVTVGVTVALVVGVAVLFGTHTCCCSLQVSPSAQRLSTIDTHCPLRHCSTPLQYTPSEQDISISSGAVQASVVSSHHSLQSLSPSLKCMAHGLFGPEAHCP